MKRKLFQGETVKNQAKNVKQDTKTEKLVEIQALALVNVYHTTCFDVKQLQEVLGIGETNAYKLVRSGKLPSLTIGGRKKVVPVSALAEFLVLGEKNLDKFSVQRSNTIKIERKVKNVH